MSVEYKKDSNGKCPVMHGSATSNSSTIRTNKDWWPNQLNIGKFFSNVVKYYSFTK